MENLGKNQNDFAEMVVTCQEGENKKIVELQFHVRELLDHGEKMKKNGEKMAEFQQNFEAMALWMENNHEQMRGFSVELGKMAQVSQLWNNHFQKNLGEIAKSQRENAKKIGQLADYLRKNGSDPKAGPQKTGSPPRGGGSWMVKRSQWRGGVTKCNWKMQR